MRIERLHLKKLPNTRDLGGLPAADGKKIRSGKLIRSGRLYKLPESTINRLKAAGLTAVIDMRTDKEREEKPCIQIKGVKYYRLPLVCTATTGITHQRSMAGTMRRESKRIKSEFGSADKYMESMYKILLFDEGSAARLKTFFDILLNEDGCVLWHCNAGKDRTGIAAMLIEAVLGVDESVIAQDYVASNKFRRRKRIIQKAGLSIIPVMPKFKQILRALMDAKPQYIANAIKDIKERYGSILKYCKEFIGLTDDDVKALRNKYLE